LIGFNKQDKSTHNGEAGLAKAAMEEAPSVSVHENNFTLVTGIGPIRVDSEDKLALAIVHGEPIIGKEKIGL
jgi:hypothetical protein